MGKTQMEKPRKVESSSDGRRLCSYPSLPEFEFWMVRNPSLPQPNILTADDLFSDGVLLLLDLVTTTAISAAVGIVEHESAYDDVAAMPELTSAAVGSETVIGSRRWRDIFKIASKEIDRKAEDIKIKKKREQKLSNDGPKRCSFVGGEDEETLLVGRESQSTKLGGANFRSGTHTLPFHVAQ